MEESDGGVIGRVKTAPNKEEGQWQQWEISYIEGLITEGHILRVIILMDYHALNKRETMSP